MQKNAVPSFVLFVSLAFTGCGRGFVEVHPTALTKPNYAAQCPPTQSLQHLMNDVVNPSLNELSYSLFHDPRASPERMKAFADGTAKILGCVDKLMGYSLMFQGEQRDGFMMAAKTLQTYAIAAQLASMQGQEDNALHGYLHVTLACSHCHEHFRDVQGGTPWRDAQTR